MGKRRLMPHVLAVSAILVFAFLAVSSGATTSKSVATTTGTETVVSSQTVSKGLVHTMADPDKKAYETLGLVFATSVTKFDPTGLEISSQEGIVTMLLREAQKLGADDILNYRVDENVVYTQTVTESASSSTSSTAKKTTTVTTKTVTYTGSALAIKYNENPVPPPPPDNLLGQFTPSKVILEGEIAGN